MKKTIFYVPAIIFTILYGALAISSIGALSPIVIIWLALFFVSGFILSKNIFWGSLIGILPGIHWIYMSTQDTGQAIDIELPLGIIVLLYYAICMYYIYKNRNAKSKS